VGCCRKESLLLAHFLAPHSFEVAFGHPIHALAELTLYERPSSRAAVRLVRRGIPEGYELVLFPRSARTHSIQFGREVVRKRAERRRSRQQSKEIMFQRTFTAEHVSEFVGSGIRGDDFYRPRANIVPP